MIISYRTTNIKSIIPKDKVAFYNSIDMGIFLYFLELALLHNHISFQRFLCKEVDKAELIPIALYDLFQEEILSKLTVYKISLQVNYIV